MEELIYETKGEQMSYYMIAGVKTKGTLLKDKTKLFLRNKECHLKPIENVFELADHNEDDIYLFLDADQVEYVSGNIGDGGSIT